MELQNKQGFVNLFNKSWFVILMLICFFPFGFYLMFRNKRFNKITVGCSATVSLLIYLCVCFGRKLEYMDLISKHAIIDVDSYSNSDTTEKLLSEDNESNKNFEENTDECKNNKFSPFQCYNKKEEKEDIKVKESDTTDKKIFDSDYNDKNLQQDSEENNDECKKESERKVEIPAEDDKIKEIPPTIDNKSSSQENKVSTVYIADNGKKYHLKKCGKGNYHTISLDEAKAKGLKPCKKCVK